MRYTYVEGHLQNMTVSPCLDMATLSIGAYLWFLMHADTLRGQVGGSWALEIRVFWAL
jgi:hypothetical protein